MAAALQGTESAANSIARVKFSHDAMIDFVIADPATTQNAIAAHFGYTPAWVSRVMNSDAFLARLAARKMEIVDPALVTGVEEKLRALASMSLDKVLEKVSLGSATVDQLLKATEMTTKALGYGAREKNLNVQQNFVVALPGKVVDAAEWANAHRGGLGAGAGGVLPSSTPTYVPETVIEGEVVRVTA